MTNPLIRAYEWLDKDVLLRQYSKVAKRWEDSGRNIYILSSLISIPAFAFQMEGLINLAKDLELSTSIGWGSFPISVGDSTLNVMGLTSGIKEENTSSSSNVMDSPIIEFYKRLNKVLRLPTCLSGVSLLGKVGYDIYNTLANGEPIPSEDVSLAQLGLGLSCLSSSMYLKGRDPKLLDKQPAWKRALQSAKEKAGELSDRVREGAQDWVPQPQPELAPVRYQTLEGYLD